MSIEFHAISDPKYWLQMIAEQLSVPVINDEVQLPIMFGQGGFKQYYPCEWLTISYSKIKVYEPMRIHRLGRKNTNLIPIVFYMDRFEQLIGDEKFSVGKTEHNGIYMHSPEIDSKWTIPANNKWNITLALTFNRERFIKDIENTSNTYIQELLLNRTSFYVFESFNAQMLELTEELIICIELETDPLKYLQICGKSLLLFYQYIRQLNLRMYPESNRKLHPSDIDALFNVRKKIIDEIISPPLLPQLAKDANMSVSKLQKSFKQVFGRNISQFTLHEKMKIAKELLSSGSNSVSEVGYKLGYSNLSHFSKAFYNEFKTNPGKYIHSLREGANNTE
ncbi:helix-turn-helix domain-containing protein [Porphyromonas gingivalis]|uniref:helix-turn-helix domain-containing protein n=1 Tax=Porphyromonas gingivalis TaxID=837 RepID=UPI000C18B03A|nr:helix-turn-helix transcriptional regulator [Porphyromonas gingivalis]ATS02800.1 transcriptional regulator [Porphyromonas gingivalis]